MGNKSFSYTNMLKGNITQTILKTLLEDSGYTVVPFGIEEIFREIKDMDDEQKTHIPITLWKMPDFIVLSEGKKETFLVEVKYRKKWDEETKQELKKKLLQQLQSWSPVYLMLFTGDFEKENAQLPSKFLRIVQISINRHNELVAIHTSDGKNNVEWDSLKFEQFLRVQDVFESLNKRYDSLTITRMIPLIEILSELEEPIYGEWADYYVSAIRREGEFIYKLKVHRNKYCRITRGETWEIFDTLTNIYNKKIFITIRKNRNGVWQQGQEICLKTDSKSGIGLDSVGDRKSDFHILNLPQF